MVDDEFVGVENMSTWTKALGVENPSIGQAIFEWSNSSDLTWDDLYPEKKQRYEDAGNIALQNLEGDPIQDLEADPITQPTMKVLTLCDLYGNPLFQKYNRIENHCFAAQVLEENILLLAQALKARIIFDPTGLDPVGIEVQMRGATSLISYYIGDWVIPRYDDDYWVLNAQEFEDNFYRPM